MFTNALTFVTFSKIYLPMIGISIFLSWTFCPNIKVIFSLGSFRSLFYLPMIGVYLYCPPSGLTQNINVNSLLGSFKPLSFRRTNSPLPTKEAAFPKTLPDDALTSRGWRSSKRFLRFELFKPLTDATVNIKLARSEEWKSRFILSKIDTVLSQKILIHF